MEINSLEKVLVNHSEQWLLVRGKKANAPLIIQVQAGPGFPMISEAKTMNDLFNWEEDYVIAYWDQRGCGKSFGKSLDPKTITLNQLTADLIEVTAYLLKKYNKDKATLVGYSIGGTLALLAADKCSSLFNSVIAVGADIDVPSANEFAIVYAREKANEQYKKYLLSKIDKLATSSITTSKLFQRRAKVLSDLGGIMVKSSYYEIFFSTLKNILTCKHYSFADIVKTIRGMEFCQNAFLPEMNELNLFDRHLQIDVPVHFFQGAHDAVAPMETALEYFDFLSASEKTFTIFDHSAHLPHLEEPKKFFECVKSRNIVHKIVAKLNSSSEVLFS